MRKTSAAPRRVSQSKEAVEAVSTLAVQDLLLEQLALSPANIRKTPATEAEDAELEASIRAKGILQNLIVHPPGSDGKGFYLVVAGGRRLRILQKLAAADVIDAARYKVPCKIEQPEEAIETSLAENTIRAAMHPADEFVAMAALIDGGATIDSVARRFGTSERHVRQRLRLGKLAPALLDAFRAGDINLETVTAFTLGADHQAQLAVWNQVKDQSYISPHRVRHLLIETAIAFDSDLGLFVGEAYKAAGGTITRDLFSADDEGFMDDAALVRRLAIEKLEAKAAELRPAGRGPKSRSISNIARLPNTPASAEAAEVPAELAAEIEQIERRLGEVEEIDADAFTENSRPKPNASKSAAPKSTRSSRASPSTATRTALAPALSSRSVIAANSSCTRASSTARRCASPTMAATKPTTSPATRTISIPACHPMTTSKTVFPAPRPGPSRCCARSLASARA